MADLLPASDIARLDVPLAELTADLQMIRLKRTAAERMRRLMVADQQYEVDHLDADSKCPLPGSYPVSHLRPGGQS
ncbi:hypothetical protein [Streptomyces sp. NBC_01264]|uniref:hypothetical protein n=1 Tax=Streptomyces sp. NBC_01264 TaxID=2903804 RepID=UPI0022588DFA|nr:hypothetical protein [Streptomyces sp. NBC_01264]MCX4778111.1 hypothetical protein [Streptomyces sp. NBC_01264]